MNRFQTKVWVFLVSLSVIFLVIGYQIGGRVGLLISFFIALFINFLVTFLGEQRILKSMKATPITGQDAWGLNELVFDIAKSMKLDTLPQVYRCEHDSVNLGSLFTQNHQPVILVTEGFLSRTSPIEKKVLLAMACARVKIRDQFYWLTLSNFVNGLLSFGDLLDSFFPAQLNLFRFLLSPIGVALLSVGGYHRNCLAADELTQQAVPLKEVISSCIYNYGHMSKINPIQIPPCSSHLFLFSGKTGWATPHPSIEKRCLQMIGYYPI